LAFLWEVSDKDSNGNALKRDMVNIDTQNTLIHGIEKLVATVWLENIVIVETKGNILVSKLSEVQKVNIVIEKWRAEGHSEFNNHRQVCLPWGPITP
jgi:mannose-1-phosphate guanylyltransferase